MEPTRLKKKDIYDVEICTNCSKQKFQNKLVDIQSTDDAVVNMLQQRFKNAKHVEIFIPEHKHNPGVNVDAEAVVDEYIVPVTVRYTICDKCSVSLGRAFNGILQLRNPTPEMYGFIKEEFKKGKEEGAYCIKQDFVENGADYQITSAGFTRRLGRKLLNKFGGEWKETAKLVSRSKQTSKDLFRVTVLFRYPKFKKGDIVQHKGRDVKVINFSGKVFVADLKTNKKEQARYENITVKRQND